MRDMRKAWCLALILLFAIGTSAKRNYTDRDVIRYTKSLDVARLDSGLRSQRLDEWLRFGPPHLSSVQWRVDLNCSNVAPRNQPEEEWTLCVRFSFNRDGVTGFGMVRVGSVGAGVGGPAYVEHITVAFSRKTANKSRLISDGSSKLSDLPSLLAQMAAKRSDQN